MMTLFELVESVAASDANILIQGENGTGKELIANAIHYNSHRASGPFIKINCASIPRDLIESELFGYKKGAFTGAAADKIGLVEMAEGGSLLLDEIGEMPAYLQTKLLRVLQEREYRPIGSDRVVTVDFRLICATNVDLEVALRDGRLREDLYFRINTIAVRVPPLRERTEDIPLLCNHFLSKFNQRYQKSIRSVSPSVYHLLIRNRWAGNVRELENAIERAVLVCKTGEITPADLPDSVRDSAASAREFTHPAASHACRDRAHGHSADAAAHELEQAGSRADPWPLSAHPIQQDEEARDPRQPGLAAGGRPRADSRRGRRLWRPVRRELRLWGQAAWRALVGLVSRNDLTHAASIAYYALLSLFPFLLLIISILGAVTADETDRARVLGFVFRYFPTRLDFLTDQLDAFRAERLRIGVAGGLGARVGVARFLRCRDERGERSVGRREAAELLEASTGVVPHARGGEHRDGRGAAVRQLLQVAEASRVGQMLASAQWLVPLQTFLFRYLALMLLMFGTGLVFYFIPNARTRFRDVWVGAILTGLLWRAALSGFSWYVRHNQRLSMIHGSITTVVVFLLWIYISSVILMYGVEFTAAYARLRRHRTEQMPAAATPRT